MKRMAAAVVACLLAVGCPGARPSHVAAPRSGEEARARAPKKSSGPGFRLSNAEGEPAGLRAPRPVAVAAPLSVLEVKPLVARLPDLGVLAGDVKESQLPDRTLPAPRPGRTVTEAFPPKGAPPVAAATPLGPLTLERRMPQGEVPLAPHVAITFSQPMVPIATHDELASPPGGAGSAPAMTITPPQKGRWRWLGTQTVMFQPETRFAMATEYTVEVAAGAKATSGATLARGEKWTFATPPPSLRRSHPSGKSVARRPLFFVELDQDVDPATMLRAISVVGGGTSVDTVLATPEEIEADDVVKRLVRAAEPRRWLAFKPKAPLAAQQVYAVRLRAGAVSAEGPRPTTKDQSFEIETFGPMRVVSHACGWNRTECRPGEGISVELSNPIDAKAFDKKLVKVSPEVAGLKAEVSGTRLSFYGATKGRTSYRVTIGKALADVHGQTLAEDASFVVDVGSAEPVLFGAERDMIVLEPAAPRAYTLYSVNQAHLRVRLYAVKPEDWPTFTRYARDWEGKVAAPGKLVLDKVVDPQAAPDELVATAVGLEPALKEGVGQAMLVVETEGRAGARDRERGFRTWIQATQLGIDGYIEPDRVTGFVTRLADGAAEANVEVGVLGAASARSDARGLATFPLGDKGGPLLYARKGGDVVIAPAGSWGDATIQRMVRPDSVRWLVFDDRGMYRPGEEVHLKGWIRRAVQKRGGDLGLLGNLRSVAFVATDPRGAQIAKGEATLDGQGSFALSFALPREGNLGSVRIALALDTKEVTETTWSHTVKVAEFRRPEFEVTARASEGPHLVGKHAVATLSAAYYAGGGLGAAKVDWRVTRSPASFTPPNRGDYHFGPRSEEGRDTFGDDEDDEPSPGGGQAVETWSALTNAQGIHRLRVDFDPRDPPHPMSLHLAASVEDKNHQQWSADTRMLVHPASEYVGLRARRAFLQPGDEAALAIVVTDLDGKAVPGRRVALRASRLEWEQKGAEYVETEVDLETLEVTSRADGTAEASFKTREAGRLLVRALVVDAEGRRNETTTLLWVAGSLGPRDRSVKGSGLVVVTDKVDYRAGDEAEVLVVSPFVPAEGVLTVRRQGIVHLERFTLKSNAQTLKIKLDDGLVPNATVQVDLVGATLRADEQGAADASLPKVPAYGSKGVAIRVAPATRVLEVKATPRSTKLEPGGATQIDVDVKDAQGHALANARVAVIVADEAVLALSRKKTPDPIAAFYGARALDVRSLGMRDRVVMMRDASRLASTGDRDADGILDSADRCPNEPETFNGLQDQDGCPDRGRVVVESNNLVILQPGAASVATPIVVRKNFSPLAVFAPSVGTDANGHAVVPVKLPDNLTRYRIMAVASAGEKSFGATESTLVARLPLMVRPSAPRFLNFGDRFELPVLLQNQTDAPLTVDVVVRATNAALAGPAGKRVEVPANDRVEVRFAAAAAKPGRARFQIGASSGGLGDASQVELPVYTPATAEAFATYGEIDRGAIAQAVARPKNVLPDYGGLEVTTSSTALQALTDAVLYLVRYPYECAEQIASRVLAVTALRDVLGAFQIAGAPTPAAMLASTKADLERLRKEQQADGGWSFWAGGETWPYLTVHVAHALTRAKDKGSAVDASTFERARGYLQRIETLFTPAYGPEERRVITAYALYVRRRMGDADAPRARRLIAEAGGVDKLPLEAIGWIWPTLSADRASAPEVEQIRRHLANRAEETASDAHFTTSYGDSSYLLLASDLRADGIVLESMIGDDPKATLIPKLAKGLLAHRTAGRWSSTQENAFVLLALARYFETYEKTTPDFVARVWLGDRFAGEHVFKGRTTERSNVGIPMSVVAASAPGELVLAKDGPGRLYYRIGMQYAPAGLSPPPADHGFTVLRRYEPIDAPDDLTQQQDAAGWFWRAKAGARIRVRVTMVTRSRRAHVALVDPLPAGFEPMNPELAVTGAIPQDPKAATSGYAWWQRTWYEHENLRDDRVEAFASLVWEGVHEYTYVARATTPGTFVAPAPRAEEMYTPETFGRGASDRVVVLP